MNNPDAEKLVNLLTRFDGPDDRRQWLADMHREFPFFTVAELEGMYADLEAMSPEMRQQQLSQLMLSVADPMVAERLATPDGRRFDNFAPAEPRNDTPSTESTIDKFLATYGKQEPGETDVLERLIFNPVPDYSQQLMKRSGNALPKQMPTGDSQDDRITRFLIANSDENAAPQQSTAQSSPQAEDKPQTDGAPVVPIEPAAEPKKKAAKKSEKPARQPEEPAADSLLSESLAKIYIKTHRYDRAYEILNRLSLAFPQKNAYFADQLRFLRKLMLVQQLRNAKNPANSAEATGGTGNSNAS